VISLWKKQIHSIGEDAELGKWTKCAPFDLTPALLRAATVCRRDPRGIAASAFKKAHCYVGMKMFLIKIRLKN
jgi:hypothetical protein